MKTLVMGSCRIVESLMACPSVVPYPGGHVHSTGEVIQAINIMKGDIVIPCELSPYFFIGHGTREDKKLDVDSFETVIIEISSIKNFWLSDLILHIGYLDGLNNNLFPPLNGVNLLKEDEKTICDNLTIIKRSLLTDCKLIVISQNNFAQLPDRYFLSHALSSWAKENSATFFDPSFLIALNGIKECFPPAKELTIQRGLYVEHENVKYDPTHFTDHMQNVICSYLTESMT